MIVDGKSVILKLAEGEDASTLNGKSFQLHTLPEGKIRLYLVTIDRDVDRCPVVIGGERCGERIGHAGKHCWSDGD